MKRLIQLAAFAAMLPLLFACGSSKKVAETGKSSSQIIREYVEDAPKGVLRGFGSYNDAEEWFAYKSASAVARSNIAEIVAVKVQSAIKLYKGRYGAESYDEESIKRNDKDSEKRDEAEIKTIAEEILQGSKVVKSFVDKQSNGTYTSYLCVEVDSDTVAKYISNNKKVQNLISEDEKMTIDFHREEFEKALKEEFDKYKEERGR